MILIIRKYKVKALFVSLLVFVISLIIAPYYVNGDQSSYIKVYNELPSLGLIDGYYYYHKYLTAIEIVPFLLSYIFSFVVDKDLFVALFNSILSYVILIFLTRLNTSFFVSSITVLTNFYLYVLYFAAERLKFGVLFFVLSLLFLNRRKAFLIVSLISIQSHMQMIIIYSALALDFVVGQVKKFCISLKFSKSLLFVGIVLIGAFLLFSDNIVHKISTYQINSSGLSGLWKVLILFLGSLFYSRDKYKVFTVFIVLFIFTYLLGGDRINMLSFFVFFYYALQVNRGINLGVLLSTIYFLYKSYFFIGNIINYGNGFY